MPDRLPRNAAGTLRSDARANRDRVLTAARELFAVGGLEVTMRQIARRAGIGPATLYRRFPTKQALLVAAFDDEVEACAAIVREAAADPDPWRGLSTALADLLVLHSHNRGFTDVFLRQHPDALDLAAHRGELLTTVAAIITRAKATGRLRADFEIGDFDLLLRAARGLATGPRTHRTAAARRLATIMMEGASAAPLSPARATRKCPPQGDSAASTNS